MMAVLQQQTEEQKSKIDKEQEEQNEADTHQWGYSWNEDNQSWDLSDSKA